MKPCSDPKCQRAANHDGMHFSRYEVDFGDHYRIFEDEWGTCPADVFDEVMRQRTADLNGTDGGGDHG